MQEVEESCSEYDMEGWRVAYILQLQRREGEQNGARDKLQVQDKSFRWLNCLPRPGALLPSRPGGSDVVQSLSAIYNLALDSHSQFRLLCFTC